MIIVISGRPGSGKKEVAKRILQLDHTAQMLPSVTTREARGSDIEGHYHYLNWSPFRREVSGSHFAWVTTLEGHSYAAERTAVTNALDRRDENDVVEDEPAPYIALCSPETVHLLTNYVEQEEREGSLERIFYFYLEVREVVLRKRLEERRVNEAIIRARLHETAHWDKLVKEVSPTSTPFRILDGESLTPRELAEEILRHV